MRCAYTTDLSEIRAQAGKQAKTAGLPDARVVDFVIAISEIAANTVRHAHSPGSMEIWSDADEIVGEIRDFGVIADPQVGLRPPLPGTTGRHGLWLVHQVCDRVDLHSDENGTVVRMHMSVRQGLTPDRPPRYAACGTDVRCRGTSWVARLPSRLRPSVSSGPPRAGS